MGTEIVVVVQVPYSNISCISTETVVQLKKLIKGLHIGETRASLG